MLCSLGSCAPYSEATLYESSVIAAGRVTVNEAAFIQYIFDNADFNTCSLDSLRTFHDMGDIQCITPASAVPNNSRIERSKKNMSAEKICASGYIIQYTKCFEAVFQIYLLRTSISNDKLFSNSLFSLHSPDGLD